MATTSGHWTPTARPRASANPRACRARRSGSGASTSGLSWRRSDRLDGLRSPGGRPDPRCVPRGVAGPGACDRVATARRRGRDPRRGRGVPPGIARGIPRLAAYLQALGECRRGATSQNRPGARDDGLRAGGPARRDDLAPSGPCRGVCLGLTRGWRWCWQRGAGSPPNRSGTKRSVRYFEDALVLAGEQAAELSDPLHRAAHRRSRLDVSRHLLLCAARQGDARRRPPTRNSCVGGSCSTCGTRPPVVVAGASALMTDELIDFDRRIDEPRRVG